MRHQTVGLLGALLLVPTGCGQDAPTTPEPISAEPEAPPAAGPPTPDAIPSDGRIEAAVHTELFLEPRVLSGTIDVEVEEGITTLSGAVASLEARRRAVARARNVRGVRAVVDRLDVAPTERPDAEIAEDVRMTLTYDPTADAYELGVEVEDGVVTLTGEVDSWHERELAERLAASVPGVLGIDDRITFEQDLVRADSEIEADVESRLTWDLDVDAGLIDVEVDAGRVSLMGHVGSARERQEAIGDAWVAGVRDVNAEALEVEPWAQDRMRRSGPAVIEDVHVERAIRDAWLYDPRVASIEPEVDVQDGVATVSGAVPSAAARAAAIDDARHTVGVFRVRDRLRVVPEEQLEDAEVQRLVRRAITADPFLESVEIGTEVENGRVRLSGFVDSEFERRRARHRVREVRGVTAVIDDVRVPADEDDPLADWSLEQEIEEQLYWSPRVGSADVGRAR